MIILFPQQPFQKYVDTSFGEEYNVAITANTRVGLFDDEEFRLSGNVVTNLPETSTETLVILRSYMLTPDQYENLYVKLKERNYVLINNPNQYEHCHYSHHVHHLFGVNSPRMFVMPNLSQETFERLFVGEYLTNMYSQIKSALGGEYFILKDLVKSEKTQAEIFKIPFSLTPDEFKERILQFINVRGKSYNKGLVFKQFVDLKSYDGITNEWRIFVLDGKILSVQSNSSEKNKKFTKPSSELEMVTSLLTRIGSNFYTIDIAELKNGDWTIIETGDGQVSGLATSENLIKFYNLLSSHNETLGKKSIFFNS